MNDNGNGQQDINARRLLLSQPRPQFQPQSRVQTKPRPEGKKMTTRIREVLEKRVRIKLPDGRLIMVANFDLAAEAYVDQMRKGSFIHHKEYMDRTEGKVPTRIADADGGKIKMYVGMPVDNEPNAP